ncbi:MULTISPECIES: ComEA family DNA-binding protein [Pseudomonas]|uniref:ComEA family DNA-binding protein n=1 Tax=Pseudomonas TaxID=286 RepID=UPI00059750CA|nr:MULTISPECIES: helix-hairpin-helix domain-containing protein [Pseudomonas]AVX90379.1 helix-hairpin-helix domain-containing protein [Pseudomonas koreensis]KIK86730.1 competence protein ComEA [Pseudomonas sp. W15Feb9B]MBI6948182.1 helix-hairpin-helix domain-containing protein [Pseudomonas koreensis]MCU7215915.1 helix-hairpin-helix domain-containing protein [Pseudomonas sp. VE 196-7]QXZ16172.1 helix-hairpin-helix domain-containing protein [Pseudomonas sp. AO-1]
MRNGFFYSLVFALLTSASIAVVAAPAVVPNTDNATMVSDNVTLPSSEKVDLNGADAATLQKQLAGVGETKAKAIVAYRDANGPFASVDELLEVKGIGKAILDRNRDKLEVN